MSQDSNQIFAELCARVRQTRHAHSDAIRAKQAAEDQVKLLEAAEKAASEAESEAMYALEDFIDSETAPQQNGAGQ